MTPIPTERLREIAFTEPPAFGTFVGECRHSEAMTIATELLAARDAMAALTKEAKNMLGIIDHVRELATIGERDCLILDHNEAIYRLRAALAATEGEAKP